MRRACPAECLKWVERYQAWSGRINNRDAVTIVTRRSGPPRARRRCLLQPEDPVLAGYGPKTLTRPWGSLSAMRVQLADSVPGHLVGMLFFLCLGSFNPTRATFRVR